MHLNRVAALGQATIATVTVTQAVIPTGLGFVRGPFVLAWGGAYVAACLASFLSPSDQRIMAATAAIGISFYMLRSLSVLTADPIPWVGVVNPAGLALAWGLYYWRSLARSGFLSKLDEIEARNGHG